MPKTTDTQSASTPPAKGITRITTKRPGFNDKNEAYPGVDPETGERKAVTLEGLKKEFGAEEGERIYFEVSRIGQHGITPQNPTDSYPPLSITGLKKDAKEEIDRLFTVKE